MLRVTCRKPYWASGLYIFEGGLDNGGLVDINLTLKKNKEVIQTALNRMI